MRHTPYALCVSAESQFWCKPEPSNDPIETSCNHLRTPKWGHSGHTFTLKPDTKKPRRNAASIFGFAPEKRLNRRCKQAQGLLLALQGQGHTHAATNTQRCQALLGIAALHFVQ